VKEPILKAKAASEEIPFFLLRRARNFSINFNGTQVQRRFFWGRICLINNFLYPDISPGAQSHENRLKIDCQIAILSTEKQHYLLQFLHRSDESHPVSKLELQIPARDQQLFAPMDRQNQDIQG
jgi:hypothetical protein